ncbi:MAG: hypothetical protein RL318_1154 [Fibrobacterota bacterium]|jgi:uncharacterized protein YbjQ (UPF0145 family)
MTGPEDSLLDAFSKEFPEIAMPGGMSPFLDDHSPIPATNQPPPQGPAASATQSLRRTPSDNISHFPPTQQTPPMSNGMLPPVAPMRKASNASQVDAGDSISSLSFGGQMGEDPFGNHSSGISPRPAAASANDPLAKLNAILFTSTDHFQGRMVEAYLGPVDAQVVVPAEVLFANDTPQGKFGRFKAAQLRLKQLTQLAQLELRNEAMKLGANALLRANLQQSSIGNAIILTYTGTAVRLAV